HPLERHAEGEDAAAVPAGADGCGVLTFGITPERMAFTFSRIAELEAGDRIVAAMTAHPELIGYEQGATDTDLMRRRPGWIAKGGAEGLFCAASPDGNGYAAKVEDGNMRGLRPALGSFL